MSDRLQQLSDAGVSIWLDDLSRERIASGNLAALVREKHVVGVTTNPTIFAAALANGERYDAQVRELAAAGADAEKAIFELTTDDVRDACDVLAPVHAAHPADGRVSIEVDPGAARDAQRTIGLARDLHDKVHRDNVLIKIPATLEGLPAITETIAGGISVNVTLIFSNERYRAVMDAYMSGLERALNSGGDVSRLHSVASFFVSRVDTEVDKRLDAIGTDEAEALKGKAGIANAWLAFAAYQEAFSTERWKRLADAGANPQRPLWASTGVKDPAYPDTLYVTELAVDGVVNTMPEKTLEAFEDHGELDGDRVTGRAGEAEEHFARLEKVGIDFDDVLEVLESEGVEKFDKSWAELGETVRDQLAKASE